MPQESIAAWRKAQARWNKANEYNREMVEAGEDLFFAGDALALQLQDEAHNGWPNIETWTVHLWLTNEQQAELSCREIAEDEESDLAAGEAIRGRWVEPLCESAGPSDGLVCDLIRRALARVDWRRIGQAFRER